MSSIKAGVATITPQQILDLKIQTLQDQINSLVATIQSIHRSIEYLRADIDKVSARTTTTSPNYPTSFRIEPDYGR